MMKYLSTLVRAAAASIVIAGAASAAPIPFTVNTATSGATATCSSPVFDTTCNFTIGLAPGLADPIIVEQGGSETFNFLRFTSAPLDSLEGNDFIFPDNAVISATLAFLNPLGSFGITGEGSGIATFLGTFVGGNLVWTAPASQFFPNIGTVSVALTDRSVGVFGNSFIGPRNFNIEATISIAPIPLPGGVVLLGTALLGLFGLSRRRKQAVA